MTSIWYCHVPCKEINITISFETLPPSSDSHVDWCCSVPENH